MKQKLHILSVAVCFVFFSCKKENEPATDWYYYSEVNCNLNPFITTNDSMDNFRGFVQFLQTQGIEVLDGFPVNHGPGSALQICGVKRHFGFDHYVLIKKMPDEKVGSLNLKPVVNKDL